MINVEVLPSADVYLPGQDAKIAVKLTDDQGQPFVGSLALTIYDKALQYISDGSNVADIREFFWKWRRDHRPHGDSDLRRGSQVLVSRGKPHMQNLGVFGHGVVDELADARIERKALLERRSLASNEGLDVANSSTLYAAAAPMQAAEALPTDRPAEFDLAKKNLPDGAALPDVEPLVREEFADTALWVGKLETNAEGIAEVDFKMPENLTTWSVRVWGMGHGTRVGEGSAEVVTRKNIIVRLQAPRFFVERDEVVLSANVHNYLPEEKQVRVRLDLEGETLIGPEQSEEIITVSAGGEQRVDWRVRVLREGTATIRMIALTDEESDAMQMSFPVYVHGMLKTEAFTGVIRPTQEIGEFEFVVPDQRRAEQTRLEIRYTPTLAGAMVDALPYLLDYPYGCTEQTLNRFLPAVVTQQTIRRMGLESQLPGNRRRSCASRRVETI